MFPEHPEIARTQRTGYPYPFKSLFCADCGIDLTSSIYISDGDVLCEDCTRVRILENHSTNELADAFGLQRTTVSDYLDSQEEL